MTEKADWKSIFLAVVLAVVSATPPTLMALAAFNKADSTHNLVNSRMSEMIELVRGKAAAEATLKEKATEKARQGEAALENLPNRIDKDRLGK